MDRQCLRFKKGATRFFAGAIACLMTLLMMPGVIHSAAAAANLSVSPSSAPKGALVKSAGSGFARKQPGTLTLGTNQIASFRTTSKGDFSADFTVPSTASTGSTPLTATVSGASATVTFTVQSSTTTTSTTTTTTTAPPTTTTTTAPPTTTTTTAPPTTTTTTAPPAPPPSGFVKASGRSLTLNGAPYRFTGINSPGLSTDYTINYGCGENNSGTDVANLFASLRPNSVVRVWAFQEIAWNKNTNTADFATLDRLVSAAAQSGQKVILVLAHQWGGGCGETFKTESWYASGYRQVVNDGTAQGAQTNPMSYWDWVRTIVPRYANSPAVAMWEPMNEPYPTVSNGGACSTTAASTLRTWFDSVGGVIHSLDGNHLVSSGLQGSGQCGTAGTEYQTLHQSPGIDVGSVHDYYSPTAAMPGDQWNGIQVRLNQMAADNKPLFVGEVGINASDTSGPITLSQRRDDFKAKMDAQMPAGMVGYMPWTFSHFVSGINYHIAPGDPSLALLHDYTL